MNVSAVILLLGDIKHWSLRIYKHTVHFTFDAVECNLTERTAKSISVLLLVVIGFCICACVQIPYAHHLSVLFVLWAWMFSVVWNGSSSSRQFIQSDGCLLPFSMWGLMAGLPDLPAMGALSIKELANNSGSPWMSQAPNLYLAMQLLISNWSWCTWSMAVQDTDHSTDARRWKELLCHKALIYCLKPNPKNIHVTKNERSKG